MEKSQKKLSKLTKFQQKEKKTLEKKAKETQGRLDSMENELLSLLDLQEAALLESLLLLKESKEKSLFLQREELDFFIESVCFTLDYANHLLGYAAPVEVSSSEKHLLSHARNLLSSFDSFALDKGDYHALSIFKVQEGTCPFLGKREEVDYDKGEEEEEDDDDDEKEEDEDEDEEEDEKERGREKKRKGRGGERRKGKHALIKSITFHETVHLISSQHSYASVQPLFQTETVLFDQEVRVTITPIDGNKKEIRAKGFYDQFDVIFSPSENIKVSLFLLPFFLFLPF